MCKNLEGKGGRDYKWGPSDFLLSCSFIFHSLFKVQYKEQIEKGNELTMERIECERDAISFGEHKRKNASIRDNLGMELEVKRRRLANCGPA